MYQGVTGCNREWKVLPSSGRAGLTMSKCGGGFPRHKLDKVQVALRIVDRRESSLKVWETKGRGSGMGRDEGRKDEG